RGFHVTGVQTCALPISARARADGWQFDVTVIRAAGQVYRLLTAAPAASNALEKTASEVGGSFRVLSASERQNLRPLRIRIVTASSEERRVGNGCAPRCA